MKTIQFNANQILCGNNYPIAYYYPIAKDLVVISTGHDDSIIDDSMGYSEYIIPILEAIQKTSIKVYKLHLASITSTVTDYKGTCLTLYAISCYSCPDSYIQISLTMLHSISPAYLRYWAFLM